MPWEQHFLAHRPPSDEELKSHFVGRESQFDELADMAEQDAPVAMRADGTQVVAPRTVAATRVSDYVSRRNALGVEFIAADGAGEQLLWTHASGKAGGITKGFLRSKTPPCCVAETTGEAMREHRSAREAHVPLANNWYLVTLY